MRNLCSLSVQTQIFSFIFFPLHIGIVLNIYYICAVFFIAEMALTMTCSFLHAPKIFFQCVQNMFLFFISHFYMDVYQQIFLIFRMILFFKLKICNMYIFCMIEFLHVTDLTHSECNMALFFSLDMCIVSHIISFGVLDFL